MPFICFPKKTWLILWFLACVFVPAQASDKPDVSLFTSDVITEVAPVVETLRAPVYRLELNLSDHLLSVEGKGEVWVTNTSEDDWNELVFRLYPNALGSQMVVTETLVDGAIVAPHLDVDDTVLRVPVSLQPDEALTVIFSYRLELSPEVRSYGRLALYQDALSLSHAYPTLSVYRAGEWLDDFPPDLGDPLVAETSFFEVSIDAPDTWQFLTTGQTLEQQNVAGRQTLHVTTGPVRDFYMAAVRGYSELSQQVGETKVRVFAPAKFSKGARSALNTTVKALAFFSELYTPYPYKEFDVVAMPVEAGGIEYPGVVVVTSGLFVNVGRLASVLAHETAHQWSFNLVGSDQIKSPWLDESLTQYLTLRFQEEYSPNFVKGYETYWQRFWENASEPTLPLGLPVTAYDEASYTGIIYAKGLFFFKALAETVGEEAFDKALRTYFGENAWKFVVQDDLKGVLEHTCTCDLSEVFNEWLE